MSQEFLQLSTHPHKRILIHFSHHESKVLDLDFIKRQYLITLNYQIKKSSYSIYYYDYVTAKLKFYFLITKNLCSPNGSKFIFTAYFIVFVFINIIICYVDARQNTLSVHRQTTKKTSVCIIKKIELAGGERPGPAKVDIYNIHLGSSARHIAHAQYLSKRAHLTPVKHKKCTATFSLALLEELFFCTGPLVAC